MAKSRKRRLANRRAKAKKIIRESSHREAERKASSSAAAKAKKAVPKTTAVKAEKVEAKVTKPVTKVEKPVAAKAKKTVSKAAASRIKKTAAKPVKATAKKVAKKRATPKVKKLSDKVTFKHGATIKNRMVQPPMLTNSGNKGAVSEDTLAYWRARSDSAGLMISEYCYVSENGGPAMTWADNRTQLAVYDDKFLPGLKKLAKTMKSHGNKALLQIVHTGGQANYRAHLGLPVYGPTTENYSFLPYGVEGFTTEQIDQVVKDFGAATRRAIKAGFDGVEIHGANHYLIQQFFSRYFNKRSDKYGKRDAFALAVTREVMRVVRKYAPKNFIVGYRISPEEINPDNVGYTWHDSTKLVGELTKKYDLDYIHLSMPSYKAKPKDSKKTFAELFRPYLGKGTKLIIVGNVMTAQDARDALKYTDLVAAGRAQLIDGNFAKKVVSGRGRILHKMSDQQEIQQKMTPGLREVFNQETRRPDWKARVYDNLDYSNAVEVHPF